MIFQYTHQQILNGTKTQTRRLVQPRQFCTIGDRPHHYREVVYVDHGGRDHIKYQVGKTYAVQPGRGEYAVGRIRITDIRQEHVQDISFEDAMAEGERGTLWGGEVVLLPQENYAALWDSIHTKPGTQWTNNPLVWVLDFELVKSDDPAPEVS